MTPYFPYFLPMNLAWGCLAFCGTCYRYCNRIIDHFFVGADVPGMPDECPGKWKQML